MIFDYQLRLVLGRAANRDRPCDQWDGAIENVKLWNRALTSVNHSGHGV
jgi:hypothetical protein